MTTNPYESPQGVGSANPQNPRRNREKGVGSVVVLIVFTIGGSFAGLFVGNVIARFMGTRIYTASDYISILHPLSLAFMVLEGLVAGYLSTRIFEPSAHVEK